VAALTAITSRLIPEEQKVVREFAVILRGGVTLNITYDSHRSESCEACHKEITQLLLGIYE